MAQRFLAGRGTAADVQREGGVPGHHRLGMRDALAQRQVLRTGEACAALGILGVRALLRSADASCQSPEGMLVAAT